MKDNEVQKNILKCSRCGLCQGVCPIYKLVKNEQATARGKLMQIWGLKKGDLKLNKKILKSLDLCLGCEKCKTNCPSGVETTQVIFSEKKLNTLGKILNSIFVFNLKLTALKAFSVFKKTPRYNNNGILFFEGCISKNLKEEFKISGLNFKKGDFECCGIPYLAKGRGDIYNQIVEKNEKIIEKSQMVVFNCATCFSAVKEYPFKNPKNKEKLIFYTDLLKNTLVSSKKNLKISYHMPCHLDSAKISLDEIEQIIKNIKNTEYKKLQTANECCGFSGDFFIRHPFLAFKLSNKKAKDIIKTNPDVILTSCPTCIWSLKFSLTVNGILNGFKKTPRVYDLADFIAKECEIIIKKETNTALKTPKKELVKV